MSLLTGMYLTTLSKKLSIDPFLCNIGGVAVTFLRSHVTGSNDASLYDAGRTTAVSLVGTHHGPGDALGHSLGHLLVVPLSNDNPASESV
jgi:hypothetical protein